MVETEAEDAQCSPPMFLERDRMKVMEPFPNNVRPAEGDGEECHELFNLRGISHVRVFEAEASALEAPEERLDFPSLQIRRDGILPQQVGDDDEILILQSRAGEKQTVAADDQGFLERPHFPLRESPEEILHISLPAAWDEEVLPDANDEGDFLSAKPCKPCLPYELPVGQETGDVLLSEESDHGAQDLLSFRSGGVAFLREEHPGNGKGSTPVDDGDGEDIDVGLSPLPVRAVHRQPVRPFGEEREHEGDEELLRDVKRGEKPLDAAVAGSSLRFSAEGQGDLCEVHCSDGDESEDELRKELQALSAEGEMNTQRVRECLNRVFLQVLFIGNWGKSLKSAP